ncbi:MAG: hypothetical protein GF344_07930 [Chitinivibrionales bacterium]|nr:hypothetical protein [Chitinivibrionales bacterium]MBD3356818.1 hypothetical protein [Chitinivibrionales bacterium]
MIRRHGLGGLTAGPAAPERNNSG